MAAGTVAQTGGATELPFQSKPADSTSARPMPCVAVMKSKVSLLVRPGMAKVSVRVVGVTALIFDQPRTFWLVPENTRTTSEVVTPLATKLQVEQVIVVPPVPLLATSMVAPLMTLP